MSNATLQRILWTASAACALAVGAPVQASVRLSAVAAIETTQAQDASYRKLVEAANAVVGVKVKALPNARSNDTLGAERSGSGIVIRGDGLVLTIGYLILEADTVEVTDSSGTTVPATIVAYDHASGFGL